MLPLFYIIMLKICNTIDDFSNEIREAWIIPLDEINVYLEDVLNDISFMENINKIPEDKIVKIRLLFDDVAINCVQKKSNSGILYTHSYTITLLPNKKEYLTNLTGLLHKKIVLLLFSPLNNFLLGIHSGLTLTFTESTDYLRLLISGDSYFPALRR